MGSTRRCSKDRLGISVLSGLRGFSRRNYCCLDELCCSCPLWKICLLRIQEVAGRSGLAADRSSRRMCDRLMRVSKQPSARNPGTTQCHRAMALRGGTSTSSTRHPAELGADVVIRSDQITAFLVAALSVFCCCCCYVQLLRTTTTYNYCQLLLFPLTFVVVGSRLILAGREAEQKVCYWIQCSACRTPNLHPISTANRSPLHEPRNPGNVIRNDKPDPYDSPGTESALGWLLHLAKTGRDSQSGFLQTS